jgi:hypothetical protein
MRSVDIPARRIRTTPQTFINALSVKTSSSEDENLQTGKKIKTEVGYESQLYQSSKVARLRLGDFKERLKRNILIESPLKS